MVENRYVEDFANFNNFFAQAHSPDGYVFTGGEFGVANIERLLVASQALGSRVWRSSFLHLFAHSSHNPYPSKAGQVPGISPKI